MAVDLEMRVSGWNLGPEDLDWYLGPEDRELVIRLHPEGQAGLIRQIFDRFSNRHVELRELSVLEAQIVWLLAELVLQLSAESVRQIAAVVPLNPVAWPCFVQFAWAEA
eukprot:168370_1